MDGRDFLFTAAVNQELTQGKIDKLCNVFGKALREYLAKIERTDDPSQKFALPDLAMQNENIVLAHLKNQTVLGGRYNTTFRSAFFVRSPIPADDISSIENAPALDFALELTLGNFLVSTS